jgi:hypothetical protein
MEILVGEDVGKTKPIQSQTKPIAGLRLEVRNKVNGRQIMEHNLKKQSQSQNDKIGVILALTMSYGDFSR